MDFLSFNDIDTLHAMVSQLRDHDQSATLVVPNLEIS